MTAAARVLIVEDTPSQAALARGLLAAAGLELRVAETAAAALSQVQAWQPDVILLDLDLPDYSGLELMRQLRAESIDCAVVVVTANASINVAVEAMREGAVDFIVKPYNKARLTVTLNNCLEKRSLAAELRTAREKLERDRFFGFVGGSPAMQAVYRTIESVAASRASVFITGESGTGKELAAEAVHRASPRRSKPFIALNCGAIPRDLLESEIFGHVKGAFTGATDSRLGAAKSADGGTLFLDEIGEMPLDMQVKLLRFVQTGSCTPVGSSRAEKVDVRFVCATNRDPMQEVQDGRFREDLFYRLYVIPVDLPPLRARGEDVVLIARHFLTTYAKEERRQFRGFSAEAERLLLAYAWPGNVRQLQNVVRNIAVLHDGEQVEPAMLPTVLLRGLAATPPAMAEPAAAAPVPPGPAAPITAAPVPPAPMAAVPVPVARVPVAPVAAAPVAATPLSVAPLSAAPVAVAPVAANDTIPALAAEPAPPRAADGEPRPAPPLEIIPLAEMERRLIMAALEHTRNDVPRAAAMLQVNPSTVYRKLQVWRAVARSAGP